MEQINESLNEALEKFHKLQIAHQTNLSEGIEALGSNIMNIVLETDINRIHECAIDAKRVWKQLKEYEDQAMQLNERQRLFNMPSISYNNLKKLIRDFEPYKNLWCTASGEKKNIVCDYSIT